MKFQDHVKQFAWSKDHPEEYKRELWYFFPEDLEIFKKELSKRLDELYGESKHRSRIEQYMVKNHEVQEEHITSKDDIERRIHVLNEEFKDWEHIAHKDKWFSKNLL